MLIYFLGCDCCGKDTLMHELAKKYDYRFYMSPRSPICNIVYDTIYDRTPSRSFKENLKLISGFLKLGAYFVLIEVDPNELLRRAKQRNEKHVSDLETFKEHIAIYNKTFVMCKKEFPQFEGRFLKVDNTTDINKSVSKIKRKIDRDMMQDCKVLNKKVVEVLKKLDKEIRKETTSKKRGKYGV